MTFNLIKKAAAIGIFGITLPTTALADNDVNHQDITLSGLFRINAQQTPEGWQQNLPNFVLNAKTQNWRINGAIKIDTDNDFNNPSARLFSLNAEYTYQDTAIEFGFFSPNEYVRSKPTNGFTHVALDRSHTLRGGIVGAQLTQTLPLENENMTLSMNAALGTKLEELNFGSPSDFVTSAGLDLRYQFSEKISAETGAQLIHFQDNHAPEGTDYYIYGRGTFQTEHTNFTVFAEKLNGERCRDMNCHDTNSYSISASAMTKISPTRKWEVAVGSANGDAIVETSLHQEIGKWRAVFGISYEEKGNSFRAGLSRNF